MENGRILAQCLTGDIYPEGHLAAEISEELATVRRTYGSEQPQIRLIQMVPPWGGGLLIKFDDESHQAALHGQFEAWDQLNDEFGASYVKIHSDVPYAYLEFMNKPNLCPLSTLYSGLQGVIRAVNLLLPGEYPTIFVKTDDYNRSYLYFWGEGDCPSGCIYKEYRYFKFEKHTNVPQFIGVFKSTDAVTPSWWLEVGDDFFDSHKCRNSN